MRIPDFAEPGDFTVQRACMFSVFAPNGENLSLKSAAIGKLRGAQDLVLLAVARKRSHRFTMVLAKRFSALTRDPVPQPPYARSEPLGPLARFALLPLLLLGAEVFAFLLVRDAHYFAALVKRL